MEAWSGRQPLIARGVLRDDLPALALVVAGQWWQIRTARSGPPAPGTQSGVPLRAGLILITGTSLCAASPPAGQGGAGPGWPGR